MTHGGIVLCGGLSSRMGRPKALLPWRGLPLVQHVVEVLRRVVNDVVIVTSADLDVPRLDAKIVRDREPKLGPLAGIREGLEAASAELNFVTATDAPFLTPAFVSTMLSFGTAAAPEVDGVVQPLSAAYPKSLARKANELIAHDRMRPLFLLEAAEYRKVLAQELPDLDSVRNLNTPDDYLAALRREGVTPHVTIELLGTARARSGFSSLKVDGGRLADVLRRIEGLAPSLKLCADGRVAEPWLVSLNEKFFVRDGQIALGPGDHVMITDAAAGG